MATNILTALFFITFFIYKCAQINIGLNHRTHMLVPASQLSKQLANFNQA